MQVVISRHPSLHDFRYVNDVSSVLVGPPILVKEKEEPIYQEVMHIEQSVSTLAIDQINEMDEDKENRPPLMPIECPVSYTPVWTPSPSSRGIKAPATTGKSKKSTKPSLTGIDTSNFPNYKILVLFRFT